MNNKKILSNKILKDAFGWSWRAWSHTFLKIEKNLLYNLLNNCGNILEIGSSNFSQVGIIFSKAKVIELGFYSTEKEYELHIENCLRNKYGDKNKIKLSRCNFRNLNGKYSIIIMKSVLGGIYRSNNSTIVDVNEGIKKIIKNNLLDGGYLITLDNGYGFLYNFTKRFGARANNWRFFAPNSLKNEFLIDQVKFGFFSNFSFQTRLPIIGGILDYLTFSIDRLLSLSKLFQKNCSSIIVSIYKHN